MPKYEVTGTLAILPYYAAAGNGMPLPASKSDPANAMKDEYGRVVVGHFTLNQGQFFYAGSEGVDDDEFFTYDDTHVKKLLAHNAVEEVSDKEEAPQQAQSKSKGKASKSSVETEVSN